MFNELEFIAAIRAQAALDSEWDRDPLSYIEHMGLPPNFTVQVGLAQAQDSTPKLEGRMGLILGDRERHEIQGALSAAYVRGIGIGLHLARTREADRG